MKWLRHLLGILVALVLLFEEWGWEPLQAAMARIARLPPLAWLERRIARLPSWAALLVMAVPVLAVLAAAALLAARTGDDAYWDWYQRLWMYSWAHLVDHRYGAWFRILDADNRKYDDEKSPAGKTDYHTMGACYEVLGVLAK